MEETCFLLKSFLNIHKDLFLLGVLIIMALYYIVMHIALPKNNKKQEEKIIIPILANKPLKNNEYRIKQSGAEILVIDDDYTNLHAVSNILKLEGYSVIAVNSGIKALEELNKNKNIDLVILDIMMPGISGYDLCIKIRETRTLFDLPILLLTAKSEQEDITLGFEAGANDFLVKPFREGELSARVRNLVELKKSVDKALESEVAFLQAQIKPHFLYNTLNTISYYCSEDAKKAEELIHNLSIYLRNSFDFTTLNQLIPLGKELELTKAYIEIEKARFGNRIEVYLDIEENIDITVPPLILQPLVENAIKHGILKVERGGCVFVTIKANDFGVVFSVRDNGIGMDYEKFNSLLKGDNHINSVGLKIIHMRLNKLYNTGIDIYTSEGNGTEVKFIIPKL